MILVTLLNTFSKGSYGERRAESKVPWQILLKLPIDTEDTD